MSWDEKEKNKTALEKASTLVRPGTQQTDFFFFFPLLFLRFGMERDNFGDHVLCPCWARRGCRNSLREKGKAVEPHQKVAGQVPSHPPRYLQG